MERETPITFAPALRKDFVTNVPSPPLAPVTTAIFPSSEFMLDSLFSRRPRHTKFRVQGQAAAREDGLPGDVRSFIGCQESKHRCDFLRGCGVSDGDVALDFTPRLWIVNPSFV